MIVVPEGPALLLVTQPDHAWLSGEILSLWRADGLPGHPRRGEILFAAREHDNGWREADSAPRCDPGRRGPYDFLSIPRQDRIAIWERGTARYAGEHPYAALLVTRHARILHRDRRGQEEWEPFLAGLAELEERLAEEAGVLEGEIASDYRFLDLADLVSLALCNRFKDPFERHGVRGEVRGNTVHLDPFPLAGATTFAVPCRRIPDRPYRGDADLGSELAASRWEEMAVRVAEI